MTLRRWRGDAPAVAQVDTLTVGGTIEADDEFTLTINGKSLTVAAGSTDADAVRDALVSAWNALDAATHPEFAEITAEATGNTGEFTLTADTPGKPFVVSAATTEAGGGAADGQTLTRVTTTANSGPNVWGVPENWSGGATPIDGDDVVIDGGADILYDLDQSAVTLASVTIDQQFGGTIGLPLSTGGTTPYSEYRDDALKIGAALLTIGSGEGAGSGRIKIDLGAAQSTVHVLNTGNAVETGVPAVLLKGAHSGNVVNVTKGSVGIGLRSGEAATVATLRVGYRTNPAGDAVVRCGPDVTLTNIEQSGGTLSIASDVATVTVTGGELIFLNGSMTTLNLDGGAVRYNSDGALTTANIGSGGVLDFRQNMRGRTVSQCNLYERFEYRDPFGTVALPNGWDFVRCTPNDGTLEIAPHQTLTPEAI